MRDSSARDTSARDTSAGDTPARGAPSGSEAGAALTVDDAYTYTSRLRSDPQSANPEGWQVDWDDGPWQVKVYRGGERRQLAGLKSPVLQALHRALARSFAISRVRADPSGGVHATPTDPHPHRGPRIQLRRPIPSGGSMYPIEVYVVFSGDALATCGDALVSPGTAFALPGESLVCHYDPYRHELTRLSQTCGESPLAGETPLAGEVLLAEEGTGAGEGAGDGGGVRIVLTNRFWKNFYKYGDFAARLGLVDAGVALGRAAHAVRTEFGAARVRTEIEEDGLNVCLGLDGSSESAFGVIEALGLAERRPPVPQGGLRNRGGSRRGAAPEVVERSRSVKRSARFDGLQRAYRATRAAGADAGPGGEAYASGCAPPDPSLCALPEAAPGAPPNGDVRTQLSGRVSAESRARVPLPAAREGDGLASDALASGGPASDGLVWGGVSSDALAQRASRGRLFTGAEVPKGTLASVLRHTDAALRELAAECPDGLAGWVVRTALHCAVHRVEGVPPGWYRYAPDTGAAPEAKVELAPVAALVAETETVLAPPVDSVPAPESAAPVPAPESAPAPAGEPEIAAAPATGPAVRDETGEGPGLVPVGAGPDAGSARTVQEALFAAPFNAELAACTVHIVTPLDWRRPGAGPRAYRLQQLGVGVAVEAVTLGAAAEGLSGHPVLGFDVGRLDGKYGLLGTGAGVQAQICVGAVRADPNWEIAVMPR